MRTLLLKLRVVFIVTAPIVLHKRTKTPLRTEFGENFTTHKEILRFRAPLTLARIQTDPLAIWVCSHSGLLSAGPVLDCFQMCPQLD